MEEVLKRIQNEAADGVSDESQKKLLADHQNLLKDGKLLREKVRLPEMQPGAFPAVSTLRRIHSMPNLTSLSTQ